MNQPPPPQQPPAPVHPHGIGPNVNPWCTCPAGWEDAATRRAHGMPPYQPPPPPGYAPQPMQVQMNNQIRKSVTRRKMSWGEIAKHTTLMILTCGVWTFWLLSALRKRKSVTRYQT